MTSTDIQSGKPTIFDSKYDKIDADCVVAGAGYPFYGISWTKLRGRYLWDGTLLSNTPLREVIDASPTCDKKVVIVNLFPHNQEELPKNMSETGTEQEISSCIQIKRTIQFICLESFLDIFESSKICMIS